VKKVIKSPWNVKRLNGLKDSITESLKPLFVVMIVVKSEKRHTPAAIRKFNTDSSLLNKAIHNYSMEEPVPGMKIDFPAIVKSHLLFKFLVQRFLELYQMLGDLDEQKLELEATHLVFNEWIRHYGSTHGWLLKQHVVKQYTVERTLFVLEPISEMIVTTSKVKGSNVAKRGKTTNAEDVVDKNTSLSLLKITTMETEMNANEKLHLATYFKHGAKHQIGDTYITTCSKCVSRKLYLNVAKYGSSQPWVPFRGNDLQSPQLFFQPYWDVTLGA
jgi:hypothetical protein